MSNLLLSGSGQAAALAGGTTMVIDFALPVDHDLEEGYKSYETKTKTAVADYALHMAVTRFDKKVHKLVSGSKLIQSYLG